jgi:hypothetical protein
MIQATETRTGLQKEIRIHLPINRERVDLTHVLKNLGDRAITLASWAITQMPVGGVAVLPQFTSLAAGNPTLPNRALVLWPYTDIGSGHINWGNSSPYVHANMKRGKLKIGFPNPDGWMAYWRNGLLFVKRAQYEPSEIYFDLGSSSECYCDEHFLELETLGPKVTLLPNKSVRHEESWFVAKRVPRSDEIAKIAAEMGEEERE